VEDLLIAEAQDKVEKFAFKQAQKELAQKKAKQIKSQLSKFEKLEKKEFGLD